MLQIENLSFSYHKNTLVLASLGYTFQQGKVYGLVGANGAGKTTFFNLIMNQLHPITGKITLDGKHHLDNWKVYQRQLTFSSDEPHFLPYLTGREWLLFVLSTYHQTCDETKLAHLLDVFDFAELDSKTASYSHGMNKKLSMIINFMTDCSGLLFDESMAGIDPFTLKKIYHYIREVKSEKIMIISSHSKELVEACSDQLIYLKNGHFLEIGQFDDIFEA